MEHLKTMYVPVLNWGSRLTTEFQVAMAWVNLLDTEQS